MATELAKQRHPWRVVIVVAGLVLVANLVVLAILSADTNPSKQNQPSAVESVLPDSGSLIRPQEDVGADLRDDYTGVLLIDRQEVPLDQLTVVEPLGQVSFRPGPGKEITAFRPGTHTATVIYWPQEKSRKESSSFSWTFKVG